MKILVYGNADGFGGAQTAFLELIRFLIAEGHDVGALVVSKGSRELNSDSASRLRLQLRTRGNDANKLARLMRLVKVAVLARRFEPAVFVSVGLSLGASLVALVLRKRCYKVCQEFITGRRRSDGLLRTTSIAFDALAVQAPEIQRQLILNGYSALPTAVLPCFHNKLIASVCHVSRPIQGNARIAYFGQLAPNKGLIELILALSRCRNATAISLDIWGDGPLRLQLEQAVKEKCMTNVLLKGAFPNGAAGAELMCSYDAIALASVGAEGLPLILLEAMAYGVPAVVTDVGSIGDCCRENPDFILVEPTIDGLVRGLDSLLMKLKNGELQPPRLRKYYQTRFSQTTAAVSWAAFLKSPEVFFEG